MVIVQFNKFSNFVIWDALANIKLHIYFNLYIIYVGYLIVGIYKYSKIATISLQNYLICRFLIIKSTAIQY